MTESKARSAATQSHQYAVSWKERIDCSGHHYVFLLEHYFGYEIVIAHAHIERNENIKQRKKLMQMRREWCWKLKTD